MSLKQFLLKRHIIMTLAIKSAKESGKQITEWVKLCIQLENQKWTSKVVKAHVVNNLCNEMILSTLFL